MNTSDLLCLAPILFVVPGVIPVIRSSHKARINLSVWAVITTNSWLAAIGNLFSDKVGVSAIYLIVNACLLTPVFLTNLKRGVWGRLPLWHKLCAGLLPLGAYLGFLMGGEFATWTSCVISVLLTAQLIETILKSLVKEHLGTWLWFLLSDGSALIFGWKGSNDSFRVLLSLWVLQCLVVIALEIRNRILSNQKKNLKIHQAVGVFK